MKTSALLLDESGNRIDDWWAYFSVESHPDHPDDAAKATVVYSFLIEGRLEDFHKAPLVDFVQVAEQPYSIDAIECLYLNRDCVYDQQLLEVLELFTRTPGNIPVHPILILPAELAGAGLLLDDKTMSAFRRGHPIWRRGALSCAPSRGQSGRSGDSDLLRNAIRTWAVISEQVVRHAFKRANEAGTAFRHRHLKLKKPSEKLVEYFLGYYPSGNSVDTPIPNRKVRRVVLENFKFETTRSEARGVLFPKRGVTRRDMQKSFYSDRAEVISLEIKRDISNFERLNPSLRFDHLAVALWNLDVLLWLRLAYSIARNTDRKRSASREDLLEAPTAEAREKIAHQFALSIYGGIPAIIESNGKPHKANISHIDLPGASEACLIAFFAGIDPRSIRAQLYPSAMEDQETLFGAARWLGTLYRHRQCHMSLQQARTLVHLMERIVVRGKVEDADDETRELIVAARMILSFLTPVGLLRLEEAAHSVLTDEVGRMVYATDPDYCGARASKVTTSNASSKSMLSSLRSDNKLHGIPVPVLVPAGRLLLPGNYSEEWVGKSYGLGQVLDEIEKNPKIIKRMI